jgi:hypothetical protein
VITRTGHKSIASMVCLCLLLLQSYFRHFYLRLIKLYIIIRLETRNNEPGPLMWYPILIKVLRLSLYELAN